jgi:hypothetical protein
LWFLVSGHRLKVEEAAMMRLLKGRLSRELWKPLPTGQTPVTSEKQHDRFWLLVSGL